MKRQLIKAKAISFAKVKRELREEIANWRTALKVRVRAMNNCEDDEEHGNRWAAVQRVEGAIEALEDALNIFEMLE